MIMPNLRTRKVLHDIWDNRTRALLAIISIAVGLLAMSTVLRARAILARDVQESLAAINPAQATLLTQPIDADVVEMVRGLEAVEEAQARQTVWGRIKAGPAGDWRAIKLVAPEDYHDMRVNKLLPESGDWPPRNGTLLLERSSLSATGAQVGDTALIEAPNGQHRELVISGLAHDLTVVSGELVDQVIFGYTTIETLNSFDLPQGFTEVDLIVAGEEDDLAHVQQVAEQVGDRIEETGRQVLGARILTPDKHVMDSIVQSLLLILGSLGLLSLVLSGFLIFNTVSAILTRQIQQVGIMKAVGAPQRDILTMYLVMVFIFSLAALAIALPGGMLGARWLTLQLAHLLNIDVQGFHVPVYVMAAEVLTALIAPLVATLFPILRGTRVTVQQAISTQSGGTSEFGGGRIDERLGELRGLPASMLYAGRNIFRRKARLLLTLLTLSMGGSVFITVLSVRASLFLTIESIADYWQQDLTVDLQQSYPMEQIDEQLAAVPDISQWEGWSTKSAFRQRPDGSRSYEPITLFAIPPDSQFVEPTLLEGHWLHREDPGGVVINIDFALKEDDIHLDDDITLTIDGQETTWHVVGICTTQMVGAGESAPEQPMAYLNRSHLAAVIGEPGRVNRVAVALHRHDADHQNEMKQVLEDHLAAAGINLRGIDTNARIRAQVENLTKPLLVMLIAMAGLFAVVGALSLTGAMSLNVLERTQEIGILRAMGASSRIVMQVVIVEGVFIGLVSWLLASLLALPLSKLMSVIVGINFIKVPLDFAFAPSGIGLWLIIVVIVSIFASYLPARSASRIRVREALVYE
jgi:putative ABC transport system permease protein